MLSSIIYFEENCTEIFEKLEFIYCADAGPGSYNIRKFNSMGGRAFIVTQSIKNFLTHLRQLFLMTAAINCSLTTKPFVQSWIGYN